MASISELKSGKRRILFVDRDGNRKTVYLGKELHSDAKSICKLVERLVSAQMLGNEPNRDDSAWLGSVDPSIRKKFERVGLVRPQESRPASTQTVHAFLDGYMERHGESRKPGTRAVWRQVIRDLKRELPKDLLLVELTVGHAKAFHLAIKKRLAETTVDKRVRFARQFFTDAVDWEIIPTNPFSKVKTTGGSAISNVHVPKEWISQVVPYCDVTWSTIIALSRFGGLRCPSEVLSLRWADIDWEKGRMAVTEPKVEHHSGRGVRTCPIFSELRPFLEKAWDQAREGEEFVVDHEGYRRAANTADGWKNANLRTQFERILRKSGLTPWKRLFHSMRASRQTELEREFPLHVVCSWLGNSPRIAQKSYLLVTESDFERATETTRATSKTTQNTTQQGSAFPRTDSQMTLENPGESEFPQGFVAFQSGEDRIRTCGSV
ncbi:tyrosine-type recombinase/integrase [Aureliella helgolandensis]|uniref:tyrosine-type recombinase/integrase n=1 Tax=Aureliella helgolandensis TaxID=2527968 RepID=UPI0011AA0566|nr:tyrosine-type recombinase/integrase [Aureliella helgolandensis]